MKTLHLALALVVGLIAQAQSARGRVLILNESGWFRVYYQFGLLRISANALKAEAEKLLGKNGLKDLQRETRQHLKDRKINWAEVDWRDLACVHFRRTQLGDDTRAVEMIPTAPPAPDWRAPEFDDASWLRQRPGRLPPGRHHGEAYEFSSLMIRSAHLRSYFLVPDPLKVKELTLNLTYRGGARVFVNGAEVARGHLPQGKLTADALAEGYPREAYLSLPDETPPERSGIFGDIRCPFDQASPARRKEWAGFRENACRQPINRRGWERLTTLRDRRLEGITIPGKLLRTGPNVLALEIRAAPFHPRILPGAGHPRAENWGRHGGTENWTWDHARLLSLELRSDSGLVPSCISRPAGAQAWVEDMHTRVFSRDFNPPGWPVGKVRIIGSPNGSFSGQVVLGTDRALTGLEAAVGRLQGVGAAAIPASAIRVSYLKGHSILELHKLGHGRCLGLYHWNAPMALSAVARYGVRLTDPPKDERARKAAWETLMEGFKFFDHVTAEAPKAVPADTCQPIWLTLEVPPDTRPGLYHGALRITAAGVKPITVPIEAEVLGWRIPNPQEFQTIVQSEQSPYGVAKHYKCRLWSEEHWKLMEVSFRQLARLGADWVFVPVLLASEFGNRDDCSMIKWIRTGDGSLTFDYTILDRYLDLAAKHLGKPPVVCFQIMHGCRSGTNAVKIFDEAPQPGASSSGPSVIGRGKVVDVGPAAEATRRPLWRAFARSLLGHMRERGMEDSMYWGHAFDRVYDPGLVKLMAEFTPGIYWAAGAHARKPDATFRAVARSYGSDISDRSMKGWKNPFVHLVMPRTNGSVICVEGTSTPFTYRVLPDRAVYCGFNGIGRMGADYFDTAWFDGFRGGEYLLVGRSCIQTLWPGPEGAESSTRNEAMLEGIQEAEARIFMEQALDRSSKLAAGRAGMPEKLARQVQKVLDDHFRATLHIPGGTAALTMMDYSGDWQSRSRTLFATAAKLAQVVGVDVDRTEIGAEKVQTVYGGEVRPLHSREGLPLPASGQAGLTVKLRNWTGKPRPWKAATTQPWIRPAKMQGTVTGTEELAITLDGGGLQPGRTLTGTLTITDVAGGRSQDVKISARVVKPVEMIVKDTVFNLTVGESARQDYLLRNRTRRQVSWKIEASAPWVKVEPGSGGLPAGASTFVKLTVRPPDKAAAVHDTKLTLTTTDGATREEFAFKTFVIPPYRAPEKLPAGRAVALQAVHQQLFVRHRSLGWFRNSRPHTEPTFSATLNVWHGHQPLVIGKQPYDTGLWVLPHHETVYRLEGSGFAAFSAAVGWNAMVARNRPPGVGAIRANFEIHVDGKVRAQSGLMKCTDPARLLVVEGLAGARQIKLVTRTHFNGDHADVYCNWVEMKFYRP